MRNNVVAICVYLCVSMCRSGFALDDERVNVYLTFVAII